MQNTKKELENKFITAMTTLDMQVCNHSFHCTNFDTNNLKFVVISNSFCCPMELEWKVLQQFLGIDFSDFPTPFETHWPIVYQSNQL
jgi:hypothetical protein